MGRVRLALLMLLLVTLPGAGVALATTKLGPQQGPSVQVAVADAAPATAAAVTTSPPTRSVQPSRTGRPAAGSSPYSARGTTTHRAGPAAGHPVSGSTPNGTGTGRSAGTGRDTGLDTGTIRPGVDYAGAATFYQADGGGDCGFPPVDGSAGSLMVGALNQRDYAGSAACGAYLAVRSSSGRSVTVRVTDRCPECPPGAIDLSRQAFARLAPSSKGQIPITWRLVSPALGGPVAYVYKDGSSRYWCAIQVRDHRNPIRSLEVRVGRTWRSLPRAEDNYFVSDTGAGCGSAIRITDVYGNRLTDIRIPVNPGHARPGHAQLPAR